jgi:hypothetical protein
MKRIGCYAAMITALTILLTAMRCTNMTAANTSEVGNPKLSGHLIDGRTGLAAQGATVRLYPVYLNKMAQALKKVASGVPAIDSALTDPAGYYSFDSLDQNVYSIQGEYVDGADTLTMRLPSIIFIKSRDLGYDTLRLPGWIKGNVVVPAGESPKNITCYIPGTSYIAITNDTGGFKISGIPEGTYSLSVNSARFNDTTLFGLTVTPYHETDAGYIALGLDRSKNEHDVWGVFDSTYNCKAIDSIEAVVSGDSIPANSPRVYKLDWRPALSGYSGFIYVPSNGFFWKVDIVVFDTLGRRSGLYRVPTINRATGDIEVPLFNPFNSVPVISLRDTTVSINDTIRLRPVVTTLADDSIVNMEWKIEDTGKFTSTIKKDSLIVAPRNPATIPWIFEVTDKFGNIAIKRAVISVITDPPTVEAGVDTIVSVNDTIRLHASGSDMFGRIVNWEWDIGARGHFIRTSTGDTAIIAPSSEDSLFTCVLRATDDDSNKVMDTVHIQVLKDVPVVGIGNDTTVSVGSTLTFTANVTQQFGYIVRYIWSLHGDTVWTDSGIQPARSITLNRLGEQRLICKVRDDDGNVAADTMNLLVVTEIGGTLPTNTVLRESASPYVVKQNLVVQTGGKLTIEPGTSVRTEPGVSWTVYGAMTAEGTSMKNIVLTATDSTNPWTIQWYGGSCKLIKCDIRFGNLGTYYLNSTDSITLDSCVFKKFNIDIEPAFAGSTLTGVVRRCNFQQCQIGLSDRNYWSIEGNTFISDQNVNISGIFTIVFNHFSGGGNLTCWGSGTVANNTIENCNGNGIDARDPATMPLLISGNTIINCKQSGVFRGNSFGHQNLYTTHITHNDMQGNGFGAPPGDLPYFNAGIVSLDSSCTIDSNTITANNIGVICCSFDLLTNNNIYNNRDYDFRVLVNDAGNVSAPNNWWGTADTATIQTKIYDYNDDNGLGKVLIDPVAPDSIPGAGPR